MRLISLTLAAASCFAAPFLIVDSAPQSTSVTSLSQHAESSGLPRRVDGQAFIPGFRSFINYPAATARVNIESLWITNVSDNQSAHVCVTLRDPAGTILRDDGASGSGGLRTSGSFSHYSEPLLGQAPTACFILGPHQTAAVSTDSSEPGVFQTTPFGSGGIEYSVNGGAAGPMLTAWIAHSYYRFGTPAEGFWSHAIHGGMPF